jgi:hypothetical protein
MGAVRKVFALLVLLLALLGTGCAKADEKQVSEKDFEIRKEYRRGPLTFTVKLSQEQISIAERVSLQLEVEVEEAYEVQLPEFGEKLEQFGIVDYMATAPRLVGKDLVVYTKSYELEPFLSGDYEIPPMKVSFWRPEEEKRHDVESEALTVRVSSLLPEKAAELVIAEIMPPVAFPRPPHRWLYGLIAGGVLCLGGSFGYLLWRKRRTSTETVVGPPAHDVAFAQLEDLIQAQLIEKGEVKLFYLRLSNTLRHYIEDRFALRAPELTTEEFLADLRDTDVLIQSHKDLLKEFLQHCDLVKFAEHVPATGEIQQAFDACKRFILETQAPAQTSAVSGR